MIRKKKGRKRFVHKHILEVLERYRGRGLCFGHFFKTFTKEGNFHNQSDIWKNLNYLIDQKQIAKVRGMTRNFYGIPLTREDGSRYLIINQGIEDEEIEVEL